MKYIKQIIVILVICLTTGCLLGEEGKGYLTKTCTLSEKIDNIIKEETVSITHQGNDMTTILIKKSYQSDSTNKDFTYLIDSFLTEKDSLKNEPGIDIEISTQKDLIEVNYTFNYSEISDYVKELYKINNPYNVQIKNLESQGYTCK